MSTRKSVISTFACIAVALSFAFAQAGASAEKTCPPYDDPAVKGDASPMADSIDANKDGKMTKDEWLKAGAPIASFEMFTGKNKKDYVTKQEMLDETPPNGVDANCDGKFTIEEFHNFGLKGPSGGPSGDGQGSAPSGTPPSGGAPAQK